MVKHTINIYPEITKSISVYHRLSQSKCTQQINSDKLFIKNYRQDKKLSR